MRPSFYRKPAVKKSEGLQVCNRTACAADAAAPRSAECAAHRAILPLRHNTSLLRAIVNCVQQPLGGDAYISLKALRGFTQSIIKL